MRRSAGLGAWASHKKDAYPYDDSGRNSCAGPRNAFVDYKHFHGFHAYVSICGLPEKVARSSRRLDGCYCANRAALARIGVTHSESRTDLGFTARRVPLPHASPILNREAQNSGVSPLSTKL